MASAPPHKSAHYTLLIPPNPRSTPSSPQLKHKEGQNALAKLTRRHGLLALLLALAFAGVLLQTNLRLHNAEIESQPAIALAATLPQQRKVLVRFNSLSNEGVGSAPQHFKSSILLADLLDREFVIAQLDSEHGYSTSDLFNAGAAAHGNLAFALPICELQEQGPALERRLRKACASPRQRAQLKFELEQKYGHCGTLYHNVREAEVIQDLNGCVHGYFQRALRHPICEARWEEADRLEEGRKKTQLSQPSKAATTGPGSLETKAGNKAAPIRVGVHFRWGDTQTTRGQQIDRTRGVQPAELNRAIATLYTCGVPLDIRVYGEGLPDWLRREFRFKHQIVDSGDAITDLCRLGQSDVIVAGASGYSVMAWHLGRNRLQLVTDVGMYKYADTNATDFTALSLNGMDSSVCEYLVRPVAS